MKFARDVVIRAGRHGEAREPGELLRRRPDARHVDGRVAVARERHNDGGLVFGVGVRGGRRLDHDLVDEGALCRGRRARRRGG